MLLGGYISIIFNVLIITISGLSLYISFRSPLRTAFSKAVNRAIIFIIMHQLHVLIATIFFSKPGDIAWGPYTLMYGPLLFYCSQVSRSEKLELPYKWLHVMPFIFATTIYISLIILPDFRMSFLNVYIDWLNLSVIISLLFYASLCLIETKAVTKGNDTERKILDQLAPLLFFSGLFFLFIRIYTRNDGELLFPKIAAHLLLLFAVLILFVFKVDRAFDGVKKRSKVADRSPSIEGKVKYRKSGLSEDQLKDFETRLNLCMGDKKLYLQANLSLGDLAKAMKVSKHNLSELLSKHIGKNYNQFINEYRVSYACTLIESSPMALSTVELMSECGFSSKNTFLKAFKNVTGFTLAGYRLHVSPIYPDRAS